MPWIEFTDDFHYWTKMSTQTFKKGMVMNATRACAEQALSQGKAVKTTRPKDVPADGDEPASA